MRFTLQIVTFFSCDGKDVKEEVTAASLGTGNFKKSPDMASYTAAAATRNRGGGAAFSSV